MDLHRLNLTKGTVPIVRFTCPRYSVFVRCKRLERLIVGALYISGFCLGQMALLAEPCCLANLIIVVMLLQITVSHNCY